MSGGRILHGLIFLPSVPRVAKSVPTYILTVAATKTFVITSVILILPNWLYSVAHVLQWICDCHFVQLFKFLIMSLLKRPDSMVQVRIPVEEVKGAVISRKLSRDVIFISLSNSCDKRNDKSDGNSTFAPMYS